MDDQPRSFLLQVAPLGRLSDAGQVTVDNPSSSHSFNNLSHRSEIICCRVIGGRFSRSYGAVVWITGIVGKKPLRSHGEGSTSVMAADAGDQAEGLWMWAVGPTSQETDAFLCPLVEFEVAYCCCSRILGTY